MKLLIFSDIHGDLGALARMMDTEADYYVSAGDLVNFGRGLDRCGPILARRANRVYVLPGNHESPEQITAFAKKYGLVDFHGGTLEAGGFHVVGLGCSNRNLVASQVGNASQQLAHLIIELCSLFFQSIKRVFKSADLVH